MGVSKASKTPPTVSSTSRGRHSFGGCETLKNQYRTIGFELLRCEARASAQFHLSTSIERDFQSSLAFIPVEVLESYFEDLLNPLVTEQKLFISHRSLVRRPFLITISVLGIVCSLVSALHVAAWGYPITISLVVALCLSAPFVITLFTTLGSSARRMQFARMLSKEIARRRGYDADGGVLTSATAKLKRFFVPEATQSLPAGPGSSRRLLH